jgi:antitoxin PrlF
MTTAAMTSKGQITVPIEVRRDLGLKTGDRIEFIKNENGSYTLKPKTGSVQDVRGMWKWTGKPLSIEEMNQVIAKGWSGQLTFED